MTRLYKAGPHAAAWQALVTAAASGFLVGDTIAPADIERGSDGKLTRPYAVFYDLASPRFDGSAASGDLDSDGWPTCQVTCVGSTPDQARDLRDRIRSAVLAGQLAVTGRATGPVRLLEEAQPTRDTDVTPHLYYAVDRYRTWSTPA